MSKDLIKDIHEMHAKYGVHEWIKSQLDKGDWSLLDKFMQFRIKFLYEELSELDNAYAKGDKEEIVDGLIDLIVVALGTLDAYDIDSYEAWDQVLRANMAKKVGQKETRPNPLGMPDLIKPKGWKGPDHSNNIGCLDRLQ